MRFGPINLCIYCRSTKELTDEHIMPFALSRSIILKRASCKECNEITRKFEGIVLRKMLGPARNKLNSPTRNPEDRKKYLPIKVHISGDVVPIEVPIEDYPLSVVLPLYDPPGIMGSPPPSPNTELKFWGTRFLPTKEEEERFASRYGTTRVRTPHTINNNAFSRFLAKVAQGYCVANFGISRFHLWLGKYIRGKNSASDPDIFHYVGGGVDVDFGDKAKGDFLIYGGSHAVGNEEYVLVWIRCFASVGGPTYCIVAGKSDCPKDEGRVAQNG